MSIATDFAQEWALSSVSPEMRRPDDITLKAFVAQLKADALEVGIFEEELEADLGDLSEFVNTAIGILGKVDEDCDDNYQLPQALTSCAA